jgi:hypothetical protein
MGTKPNQSFLARVSLPAFRTVSLEFVKCIDDFARPSEQSFDCGQWLRLAA